MKAILLFLIFFSGAFAEAYDGQFAYINHEFQLKEDGSEEYHYGHRVHLNSYYSVNRLFGETFVIFDTVYQTLKIQKSETTMRDGRVVPSPENAFNLVLPRMSNHAPAYNQLREMVITHTGLEVGASIDLEYVLSSKSGYQPGFSKAVELLQVVPTETLKISLTLPADKKLYHRVNGIESKVDSTTKDNVKTYHWHFFNLPSRNEFLQKHHSTPELLLSTYESYTPVFEEIYSQEQKSVQMLDEAIAYCKSRTADLETDLHSVLTVQEILANEIKTYPIPLAHSGYRFRQPVEIWITSAGTPAEKAALFRAILTGLGFDAHVALVTDHREAKKLPKVPQIFDDALVRVNFKNSGPAYFRTDKVMERSAAYELAGKLLLEHVDDGFVYHRVDEETSGGHRSIWSGEVIINDSSSSGICQRILSGALNPYYTLIKDESALKSVIQSSIKSVKINDVELKELTDSSLKADAEFEQNLPGSNNKQIIYDLPLPADILDQVLHNVVSQSQPARIDLDHPFSEKIELKIIKPEDWLCLSGDTESAIETEIGKVFLSLTSKGNELSIIRNLEIYTDSIPAEEYEDFLNLWRAWKAPGLRQIVFMKSSHL